MAAATRLPSANSPTIALVPPTAAERKTATSLNSVAWCGALSLEQYLERDELTNEFLGMDTQPWILVDTAEVVHDSAERTILCSCETLRRRGIVAVGDKEGKIEKTYSYGVASVFTRPEFRNRGYASRMMRELASILAGEKKVEGVVFEKGAFSVLYSDIGKEFYARNGGWHPFPSSHLSIIPTNPSQKFGDDYFAHCGLPETWPLTKTDDQLATLCELDCKLLTKFLSFPFNTSKNGPRHQIPKALAAISPDLGLINWHLFREEFMMRELFPENLVRINGAIIGYPHDPDAWIIWCREWTGIDPRSGKPMGKLYILRLVVVHGKEKVYDRVYSKEKMIASMLLAAIRDGCGGWGINEVVIWNAEEEVLQAARGVFDGEGEVEIVDREAENICALSWLGAESEEGEKDKIDARKDVEWVGNERYGWC